MPDIFNCEGDSMRRAIILVLVGCLGVTVSAQGMHSAQHKPVHHHKRAHTATPTNLGKISVSQPSITERFAKSKPWTWPAAATLFILHEPTAYLEPSVPPAP